MMYYRDLVESRADVLREVWQIAIRLRVWPVALTLHESGTPDLDGLASAIPEVARSLTEHPTEESGGPWFLSLTCEPARRNAPDSESEPLPEGIPVTVLGVAAHEYYILDEGVRNGGSRWADANGPEN